MRKPVIVAATAVLAVALSVAGIAVAVDRPATGTSRVAPTVDFTNPTTAASNLRVPWGMTYLPDGTALVAERDRAQILRVRPGLPTQIVGSVPGVVPGGEGGLLGLVVSPTYATDNLVYAYYTAATDNRIVRFTLANMSAQTPIVTGIAKANVHNGGRIAFGPDGMLYAGVGDAGVTSRAQNPGSLNGKILRIRPDGGVPADNPTAGSLVYSLGHRNVQGLAWDDAGRLYATEFGQNTWDEVNRIVPGGNYGWPVVEGNSANTAYRNPIVTWSPAEASPSGAAIIGDSLFVAALRGNRLWVVPLDGNGGAGTPTAALNSRFGRLRTVERGPDGSLWVATSNRDGRGNPTPSDDRVFRFSVTLPSPSPTPTATPTVTPTTDPTTDPTTTPTATPTTDPTTTPTATPTVTTPATACSVSYGANAIAGLLLGNVRVINRGPAVSSWTLTWTFGGNQRITSAWGARVSQSGRAVTARNDSWNGNLPTGASANFGFLANGTGTARPTDFRLNGTACAAS
ncbi:PQQ-dependent sugar dehydrogenase [Asanoa sp. WMMD1127]|uniref:PQQ-dependent sugar dehydrogenase n=1 Tax=Asanoa sp. WMMD1127 TaxID=3016107 RepID=UPI0024179071|nr:PQQ-dependent sugar dehydrogenase [Asanoa sp. WMMD1127]MDG4821410.1 PQQ-dependent sugar dehydrogenase [Asanoa sp. WMMD1127]